jgi:hypothetical protein
LIVSQPHHETATDNGYAGRSESRKKKTNANVKAMQEKMDASLKGMKDKCWPR